MFDKIAKGEPRFSPIQAVSDEIVRRILSSPEVNLAEIRQEFFSPDSSIPEPPDFRKIGDQISPYPTNIGYYAWGDNRIRTLEIRKYSSSVPIGIQDLIASNKFLGVIEYIDVSTECFYTKELRFPTVSGFVNEKEKRLHIDINIPIMPLRFRNEQMWEKFENKLKFTVRHEVEHVAQRHRDPERPEPRYWGQKDREDRSYEWDQDPYEQEAEAVAIRSVTQSPDNISELIEEHIGAKPLTIQLAIVKKMWERYPRLKSYLEPIMANLAEQIRYMKSAERMAEIIRRYYPQATETQIIQKVRQSMGKPEIWNDMSWHLNDDPYTLTNDYYSKQEIPLPPIK
jgi:hypothetical protein